MAEGTGVEPASPCGRRFSRPLQYHYATPPRVLRVSDYIAALLDAQPQLSEQCVRSPTMREGNPLQLSPLGSSF